MTVLHEVGTPMQAAWVQRAYRVCMRVIVPAVMVLVLMGQISDFFGLKWF